MYTCYLCVPTLTSYNREQYHTCTCALNLQVKNFDHMEAHTSAKYQFLIHESVSKTLDKLVVLLHCLTGQQTNCTWPNKNNVLLSILNYSARTNSKWSLLHPHYLLLNNDYWTMIKWYFLQTFFQRLFIWSNGKKRLIAPGCTSGLKWTLMSHLNTLS